MSVAQGFLSVINRLTSPVFYSTTEDGRVIKGLGGIPATRPLLLVGNHQLFAADMYPMFQEFVKELGVVPRGLAHPVVFAGPDILSEAGAQGGMAGGGNQSPEDRTAGAMQFGSLLSTYGAVPVSGRNMHKLLEQGEMVLLYPGGAREVSIRVPHLASSTCVVSFTSFACCSLGSMLSYVVAVGLVCCWPTAKLQLLVVFGAQAVKRRGEAYKLIWPERAEFVRMAAKFGATIVPFAAIGADEAVTTHINGDELERLQKLLPQPPQLPFDLPFLPRQEKKQELSAEERRARIPRARKGVNAMEEDLEAFMSVSN
jgi:1-acyl-sn-glycerol-3-phosphate acyltransferase